MSIDSTDMPWARGPLGPVAASTGIVAKCYDCGETVTGVREHIKQRNGISYTVRAHFRHKSDSTCAGETWQHKAAKHRVATENLKWFMTCVRCNTNFDVAILGTASEEQRWQQYYLDVGFADKDGCVTGAVEVLHTHAVDDKKCNALTKADVAWIEVAAHEVLSCSTNRVRGVRAACHVCASCQMELRKQEDAQSEAWAARLRERAFVDQQKELNTRLAALEALDTGANNVALNTLRQKIHVAREHVCRAEKYAKSKQIY